VRKCPTTKVEVKKKRDVHEDGEISMQLKKRTK
jgi:hypothetical protein